LLNSRAENRAPAHAEASTPSAHHCILFHVIE
jgi:hypothetical protein